MSISLSCAQPGNEKRGYHHLCMRPSCECYCHVSQYPHRLRAEDRTEAVVAPPPRRRPTRVGHRKDATYSVDGVRICPVCFDPLIKKPGPGRYMTKHPHCKVGPPVPSAHDPRDEAAPLAQDGITEGQGSPPPGPPPDDA